MKANFSYFLKYSKSFLSAITLAGIFLVLLVGCDGSKEPRTNKYSWPEVLKKGEGTLKALFVPAEGFAYYDKEGELTGVTVDLLNEFANFVLEQYNVKLDIEFEEEQNWSTFYRRVAEGDDGLIGFGNVTITEERRSELVFSPSYMSNIACLISHESTPYLYEMEKLDEAFAGMNALAFRNTLHEERLREITRLYYPEAVLHLADSNDEIVRKVSEGGYFFAYIDVYNYWRAVQRGMPLKRHSAADMSEEEFGYIMPLNTTWEPVIKEYFKQGDGLIHTRVYRNTMEKHLGAELTEILLGSSMSND